jgi:hypothetical protein
MNVVEVDYVGHWFGNTSWKEVTSVGPTTTIFETSTTTLYRLHTSHLNTD